MSLLKTIWMAPGSVMSGQSIVTEGLPVSVPRN